MADKKLIVEVGAKIDKLEQGLKQAENRTSQFGNVVKKVGGLIAGAFAVSEIISFTAEASRLAGVTEGVRMAFVRLGQPGLLDNLVRATHGTVSNLKLMQYAVRASNFKIPLDQLATYFEFATKRAQQTAFSVDYLVDSIVAGIGRKSSLVLDNLGISLTELQKEMKVTGDFAAAAGNIIKREMGNMDDYIETATSRAEQLNAQLENMKTIMGEKLNPVITNFRIAWMKFWDDITNRLFSNQIATNQASAEFIEFKKSLETYDEGAQMLLLNDKIKNVKSEIIKLSYWFDNLSYVGSKTGTELYSKFKVDLKTYQELLPLLQSIDLSLIPKGGKGGGAEGAGTFAFYRKPFKPAGAEYPNLPPQDKLTTDQFLPALSENEMNELKQFLAEVQSELDGVTKMFDGAAFAAETFANALSSMDPQNLKDVANALRQAAKEIIATLIAETVTRQVAKAAAKEETWQTAIIIGAAAGAATKLLFNNVIPSFAEGGIVKGPQLAMVGDNPSGREAIIPLDRYPMKGFQLPQLAGYGKDIYWINREYQNFLDSTT